MKNQCIDISWPITDEMTEYKDRKTVAIKPIKSVKKDGVFESNICFHSHTGTHIDAPAHFIDGGKTIDQLPLSAFNGSCRVLDLAGVADKITVADLKKHAIESGDIILLKTKNSDIASIAPFNYDFVYLDKDAAQYLVDKKIKAVGIDYLGIERNQPDHETHKRLLSNDIPIIEGLCLKNVATGQYTLSCLPLNFIGADAAPARAVLL